MRHRWCTRHRRGEPAPREDGAALLLAPGAAVALGDDHPLAARAWNVAGWSAHFLDYAEQSQSHFAHAKRVSLNDDDQLIALWGDFNSRRMTAETGSQLSIAELEPISGTGIDGALRYATARATLAERMGGLEEALEQNLGVLPLLAKARNPAIITSYLNTLGRLLIGRARYDEAVIQFQAEWDLATR